MVVYSLFSLITVFNSVSVRMNRMAFLPANKSPFEHDNYDKLLCY